MINIIKTLLGLSVLLLPWVAHAEIFICKDAAGRTLTSDRPIYECAGAIRELGSNGLTKRTIAAPLTAEQKQQKQIEDEKRKVEASAAAEQKRQDRAMLARYNNEFEISAARKRALDQMQEQMKRETAALTDSEKQLASAQTELAAYKNKQTKPPVILTRKVETAESNVQERKKTVQEREAQIAQINSKFDDTLKRFNEITAAAPSK